MYYMHLFDSNPGEREDYDGAVEESMAWLALHNVWIAFGANILQ